MQWLTCIPYGEAKFGPQYTASESFWVIRYAYERKNLHETPRCFCCPVHHQSEIKPTARNRDAKEKKQQRNPLFAASSFMHFAAWFVHILLLFICINIVVLFFSYTMKCTLFLQRRFQAISCYHSHFVGTLLFIISLPYDFNAIINIINLFKSIIRVPLYVWCNNDVESETWHHNFAWFITCCCYSI